MITVDADAVMALAERGVRMRGFQRGVTAVGAHILSKVATYPPQDPNANYRRTGTLGRRWVMVATRNGYRITIGNNTPYAPRVQGEEQVEYFRRVGWKTPLDVIVQEGETLQRLLDVYVQADL